MNQSPEHKKDQGKENDVPEVPPSFSASNWHKAHEKAKSMPNVALFCGRDVGCYFGRDSNSKGLTLSHVGEENTPQLWPNTS